MKKITLTLNIDDDYANHLAKVFESFADDLTEQMRVKEELIKLLKQQMDLPDDGPKDFMSFMLEDMGRQLLKDHPKVMETMSREKNYALEIVAEIRAQLLKLECDV